MELLGQAAQGDRYFCIYDDWRASPMTVECVSGSSCWVWGNPQDVQVMIELINDPEKQTAILGAVSLPPGADASLCVGLSLASPEMSLLFVPSSLTAINIADLSHAGAESLLGVSIFNYLTCPISATLSPVGADAAQQEKSNKMLIRHHIWAPLEKTHPTKSNSAKKTPHF